VVRGERPIKVSDSWFSAKNILVLLMRLVFRVKSSLKNAIVN